jgi:hypothetical protein
MSQENEDTRKSEQTLQTLFAAELFSKLPQADKQAIIAQIEALLSRG